MRFGLASRPPGLYRHGTSRMLTTRLPQLEPDRHLERSVARVSELS
jgi:hypothetical protein